MKHIQLTEDKTSPFETIIQFGCGPHFVFNRLGEFETMIKEQGIIFWFRFWLCFCGQPSNNNNGSSSDEVDNLSNLRRSVLLSIHNQLLLGSVEETTHYCLYKAVMQLVVPINPIQEDIGKEENSKHYFHNLVKECSDMAFGAALCEMFYKWLFAKTVHPKSQRYWTIPKKYLDPKFKPGALETFLVNAWGDNLVTLIGLSLSQIPKWLLKLMNRPPPVCDENWLENTNETFVQKMAYTLTQRRNLWRLKIDSADEVLKLSEVFYNMEKNSLASVGVEDAAVTEEKENTEVVVQENNNKEKDHSPHKCSFCQKALCNAIHNVCDMCKQENWDEPRYYCSDSCKIEHMFEEHRKEHFGVYIPEPEPLNFYS